MLRAIILILCALVGAPSAMRVAKLKEYTNSSSTDEAASGAECCCKEGECDKSHDSDGNRKYEVSIVSGENWCCKKKDSCGKIFGYFGYSATLDKNDKHDELTCEMKVSNCPACQIGEAVALWSESHLAKQVCGCACEERTSGAGCDYCGHGYGPKYPNCELKQCRQWEINQVIGGKPVQACNGHGTNVGYGDDCSCECEAGWHPKHKCKLKLFLKDTSSGACVQDSYLLYAELLYLEYAKLGHTKAEKMAHSKAEKMARLYCLNTKDKRTEHENVKCLKNKMSECMHNRNGYVKSILQCAVDATELCL